MPVQTPPRYWKVLGQMDAPTVVTNSACDYAQAVQK